MDLSLLSQQTSPGMAREVDQFGEPITHLKVETLEEWVTVYFVLAETGFEYQFNKRIQRVFFYGNSCDEIL